MTCFPPASSLAVLTAVGSCLAVPMTSSVQAGRFLGEGGFLWSPGGSEIWARSSLLCNTVSPWLLSFWICTQKSYPRPSLSHRAPVSPHKAQEDSLVRESHRKHTSTYRHSFGSLGTISRVESYRMFLCCSCLVTYIPSSENVRPRKGSWRDWLIGEISQKPNAGGRGSPCWVVCPTSWG